MLMRYLLDTDAWILYLNEKDSPVENRLRLAHAHEIAVCALVRAELLHRARDHESRREREARIFRVLSPFRALPFDRTAARHYAAIHDEVTRSGHVIAEQTLLIAAIARMHSLTVISNNPEFRLVSGLEVEDWTESGPSLDFLESA